MKKAAVFLAIVCFHFFSKYCLGQNWLPVGSGLPGAVLTINKWNNNIFASGDIPSFNNTALFNGTGWNAMSGGTGSPPICSEAFNNTIVIAGGFSVNGLQNIETNNITIWNNTHWDTIGSGTFVMDFIRKLCVYNNELYGGGHAISIKVGNNWVGRDCFKLTGTSWDTLPNFSPLGLNDLDVFQNKLYITSASEQPFCSNSYMYQYDGFSVIPLCDSVLDFFPHQSAIHQNSLYVAGLKTDTLNNQSLFRLVRFDGIVWHQVGTWLSIGSAGVFDMISFNNELFIGGDLRIVIAADTCYNLAKYSLGNLMVANEMSVTNPLSESFVHCFFNDTAENDLYAGGYFNMAGGVSASNITVWDLPTSINNAISEKDFISISPNPTSSTLNISLTNYTKPINATLTDIAGRTINQFKITSANHTLNVSHIRKGIYFLRVDGVVKKLVVE